MLMIVFPLLMSSISTYNANAFPQARLSSIAATEGRGFIERSSTRLYNILNSIEDAESSSDNQKTRRELFYHSIYSIGLALAATSANPSRGNAIEFGLPNILLSVDGDNRATKGMPAPNKKSSGLGYKIRSVSKIMVSS